MNLLSVRGLSVTHAGTRGVHQTVSDVSFDVNEGEVAGLVGESGCGKSTLALALIGLTREGGGITAGAVRFRGKDLLALDETAWRSYRGGMIGFITQNPRGSLNPLQRVGDQIMFHFRVHSRGSSAGARKRTLELLERVGIGDAERRFRSYPHELSGGMAQRVLIAMALVTSPELLIADEPTTALDVTIQAQVLDLLAELRRDYGLTVILITHDLGVVANYCDTIHLMNAGELVEDAPALTFFEEATHPAAFALLAAQTGQYDRSRVRMRGFPPDLRKVPPGCRLQKRCPFASEVAGCQTVHPELMPVGLDHRVRCHRSDEVRLLVKNQQPEDQHERSDVHAT